MGKFQIRTFILTKKIGSYFDPPSMETLEAKLRSGELSFIEKHCKRLEMTELEAEELLGRIKKSDSDNENWTKEDDSLILEHVRKNGPYNFVKLEQLIGKKHRQIRERWLTHLSREVSKIPWSNDEDEILIRKQRECGTNWGLITLSLPGRSDICCKNRWCMLMRERKKIKEKDPLPGIIPQNPDAIAQPASAPLFPDLVPAPLPTHPPPSSVVVFPPQTQTTSQQAAPLSEVEQMRLLIRRLQQQNQEKDEENQRLQLRIQQLQQNH